MFEYCSGAKQASLPDDAPFPLPDKHILDMLSTFDTVEEAQKYLENEGVLDVGNQDGSGLFDFERLLLLPINYVIQAQPLIDEVKALIPGGVTCEAVLGPEDDTLRSESMIAARRRYKYADFEFNGVAYFRQHKDHFEVLKDFGNRKIGDVVRLDRRNNSL